MLRCSELVCLRYEAWLIDDIHIPDRNKIESSEPFTLDRESVPNDAKGDTLLFDERICDVVENQPNG